MPVVLTKKIVEQYVTAGRRAEIADARQPGLVLRANARTSSWMYVWSVGAAKNRLVIGDPGDMSIDDARKLVAKATDLRVSGWVPDPDWIAEQRTPNAPVARVRTTWTLAEAKEVYLAEVLESRKPATYADYRKTLAHWSLAELQKRYVADVTEEELSEVLAAVHRKGLETTAEGLKRKLTAFWAWLQRRDNRTKSGVSGRIVIDLPRSRTSPGKALTFPHPAEVGKLYKMALTGELGIASAAIVLLCRTAQRRETIATVDADHVYDGVWHIPPAHRKTAQRRQDNRIHALPWPSEIEVPETGPVFPAAKRRRKEDDLPRLSSSTITHVVRDAKMTFKPHDIRRSFTTAMRLRGFTTADVELVLDHNEGAIRTVDIHYDAYRDLDRKSAMLDTWNQLLIGNDTIAADEWARATGKRQSRKPS